MAGANHHHHDNNSKSTDRKSRLVSNSSAPKNHQSITSNSKASPSPNNSNFNRKPTPQPSQSNKGPSLSNHKLPTHGQPDPFPYPDLSQLGPPPQPTYGFHMLLRRTVLLADETVRSYFALPPDYENFATRRILQVDGPGQFRGGMMSPEGAMHERGSARESRDYWESLGLDNIHSGRVGEGVMKRKFRD